MLPPNFFTPSALGVAGGVEFGFFSTSTDRDAALSYAAAQEGSSCPTIFEMPQGMVDRGAEMSCFSQYPWEDEVPPFPPSHAHARAMQSVLGNACARVHRSSSRR